MTAKKVVLSCLLALFPLAPACGDSVNTSPSAIIGGVWQTRSIETVARGRVGITEAGAYTVEFRDGGSLAAKVDCNRCSGTYSISGRSLNVVLLGCTKAGCGGIEATDFENILRSATTFGVRGLELSIESPSGRLRMSR